MIAMMIFVGYLLMSLLNFRYTGHKATLGRPTGHSCAYQSSCYCRNCGGDHFDHLNRWGTRCKDGNFTHWADFVWAGTEAIFWPITDTAWLFLNANKKLGFSGKFFAPAPMVKTRQEKILEIEARVAAINADTDKILAELDRSR